MGIGGRTDTQSTMTNLQIVEVDAATFQPQISRLAEPIAQKVKREGDKHLNGADSLSADIFISIRQAKNTYDFLCWIHSDDIKQHYGWKDNYTFAAAPLVRNLIDNLFNITLMLQDPVTNARSFRVSGFRKDLLALDSEERRYRGNPDWDKYTAEGRNKMATLLRQFGMTESEVRDKKAYPDWPTFGKYLAQNSPSAYRQFMESFSFGQWKRYSAIAHGAAEGLHEIGAFLNRDGHKHEDRHHLDEAYPRMMSYHIAFAAILLLPIITEVQAAFMFEDAGARINGRISKCWQALMPILEAKEIYENHYRQLMKEKKISC